MSAGAAAAAAAALASAANFEVSQNDLRELRRVFDFLADFAPKHKLRRELGPKLERRAKIATYKRNPDAVKIVDETGVELPAQVVDLEDARLEAECAALQRRIDELGAKPDSEKRIHGRDLQQALEFLGKSGTDKREVEDMIWEVDEDLDGCVDWAEFQLMFRRNITDKTGLEPSQLFSVVQFLMYDKEFTGCVSLDQTMHMLYNRYGKERLEAEMKALFGESVVEEGNAKLGFLDYLRAVKARAAALAAAAAEEQKEKYAGAPGKGRRRGGSK